MIVERDWKQLHARFSESEPFRHVVIDDFFLPEVAEKIVQEFTPYQAPGWRGQWNNAVENKKLHNVWDLFPPTIYCAFDYLTSNDWVSKMCQLTGRSDVKADVGLNGGGLHSHTAGGHLNVHLDYIRHPKMPSWTRNFNLIVYVTPDWNPAWGGGLELWSHDADRNLPKEPVQRIDNQFNRAVIFDTKQNSWHGLPEKIQCPEGVYRNSMAVYYLTPAQPDDGNRMKALFAPHGDQANDPEVLELIRQRADAGLVRNLYRKEDTL